jgi:hypothetical protein
MAYLIGELGGLIPVPGGIGGVDAGLVGTFVLYNVPITVAASAVLAYRAIALWVPAILGSAAFVSLRRGWCSRVLTATGAHWAHPTARAARSQGTFTRLGSRTRRVLRPCGVSAVLCLRQDWPAPRAWVCGGWAWGVPAPAPQLWEVPTMSESMVLVGLDVHRAQTVAAVLDRGTGELRVQRLRGEAAKMVPVFLEELERPACGGV